MPVLAAALCFHVAARLWSFIRDSCPLLLRCNETHPPNCPIKRGSERVTFRRADVRMFWWPSSQRLYFDCAADKTESGKKKKKVPWLHFKTRPCCKLCTFIKKKKKKKRQKNTTTWRVKLYTYEVICNPLISQEPVFHFSPQNSMRVCRSRQRGDRAAVSHASGLFYCFNTWNNQLLFLCATSQFWNRLITLPRFFQRLHLTAQTARLFYSCHHEVLLVNHKKVWLFSYFFLPYMVKYILNVTFWKTHWQVTVVNFNRGIKSLNSAVPLSILALFISWFWFYGLQFSCSQANVFSQKNIVSS